MGVVTSRTRVALHAIVVLCVKFPGHFVPLEQKVLKIIIITIVACGTTVDPR